MVEVCWVSIQGEEYHPLPHELVSWRVVVVVVARLVFLVEQQKAVVLVSSIPFFRVIFFRVTFSMVPVQPSPKFCSQKVLRICLKLRI